MLQFCHIEDDERADENEEVKIHGRTDRLCVEVGGTGSGSARSMPEDGDYVADILPLEEKVWWVNAKRYTTIQAA